MLDPTFAFDKFGLLALIGWLALLVALFMAPARRYVIPATRYIIPGLIAVAYVVLISQGFREAAGGNFNSIAGVRSLFANDSALAAGWLHYLAFDLFVGSWIAQDATARPMWLRVLAIPCLFLTLMFGPGGLLLYLLLRLAAPRRDETA